MRSIKSTTDMVYISQERWARKSHDKAINWDSSKHGSCVAAFRDAGDAAVMRPSGVELQD